MKIYIINDDKAFTRQLKDQLEHHSEIRLFSPKIEILYSLAQLKRLKSKDLGPLLLISDCEFEGQNLLDELMSLLSSDIKIIILTAVSYESFKQMLTRDHQKSLLYLQKRQLDFLQLTNFISKNFEKSSHKKRPGFNKKTQKNLSDQVKALSDLYYNKSQATIKKEDYWPQILSLQKNTNHLQKEEEKALNSLLHYFDPEIKTGQMRLRRSLKEFLKLFDDEL